MRPWNLTDSEMCTSTDRAEYRIRIGTRSGCNRRIHERRATHGSSAILGTFVASGAGVAEEARTRGFAPPALAGFAFLGCCSIRLQSKMLQLRSAQ